jgi:hypothetical protein
MREMREQGAISWGKIPLLCTFPSASSAQFPMPHTQYNSTRGCTSLREALAFDLPQQVSALRLRSGTAKSLAQPLVEKCSLS